MLLSCIYFFHFTHNFDIILFNLGLFQTELSPVFDLDLGLEIFGRSYILCSGAWSERFEKHWCGAYFSPIAGVWRHLRTTLDTFCILTTALFQIQYKNTNTKTLYFYTEWFLSFSWWSNIRTKLNTTDKWHSLFTCLFLWL